MLKKGDVAGWLLLDALKGLECVEVGGGEYVGWLHGVCAWSGSCDCIAKK